MFAFVDIFISVWYVDNWRRCISICWRNSSASRRRWSDCQWTTKNWCGSWVKVMLDPWTTMMMDDRLRRGRRLAACSCPRRCRLAAAEAGHRRLSCRGLTTVRVQCLVRRRADLDNVERRQSRPDNGKTPRLWQHILRPPVRRHQRPLHLIPATTDFVGPARTTSSTTSSV